MDFVVYKDDDGSYYMYFGGIWGGQLQCYEGGIYNLEDVYLVDDVFVVKLCIVKMVDDMLLFVEVLKEVEILDKDGMFILQGDNDCCFFEVVWVYKYQGKYYFFYSIGDIYKIVYVIGDNLYGLFIYQGVILKFVFGWINYYFIVKFKGKWYLFYYDSLLFGGKMYLCSVKMIEFIYNLDGIIVIIDLYLEL